MPRETGEILQIEKLEDKELFKFIKTRDNELPLNELPHCKERRYLMNNGILYRY